MEKEKWIKDLKEKLSKVGNRFEFDDLTLEMSDGNRIKCEYATVNRENHLYIGMILPYGGRFEIGEGNFENIVSPNAIWNAIRLPDPKAEVIEEIKSKLCVQPVFPYTFEELFEATLEDGNSFAVEYISLDDNDEICVALYKDYTDIIKVGAEDIEKDSLQDISDEIMPPKEVSVYVHYPLRPEDVNGTNNGAFCIHSGYLPWNCTEEQLLQYLKEKFPTFEWQSDDELQYVYYPNNDDKNCYILAIATD